MCLQSNLGPTLYLLGQPCIFWANPVTFTLEARAEAVISLRKYKDYVRSIYIATAPRELGMTAPPLAQSMYPPGQCGEICTEGSMRCFLQEVWAAPSLVAPGAARSFDAAVGCCWLSLLRDAYSNLAVIFCGNASHPGLPGVTLSAINSFYTAIGCRCPCS
jgi:hypothetical protein